MAVFSFLSKCGEVVFILGVSSSLSFPPFLALLHSASLFHTLHPVVVDMCLGDVSDSISSCSVSQLHLGQPSNLKQCDGLPTSLTPFYISPLPFRFLSCPCPFFFSLTVFTTQVVSLKLHLYDLCFVDLSSFLSSLPPPIPAKLSSAVCFHSRLRQTQYLCRTAPCFRQQRLAAFYCNIVRDGQCDN